ncbi:unnamed protein product [Calicophoron daubneyi]|uniref:SH3 domain-containing protein n=1 Tax=Calicophoron daubneyi TaxID=300641 RepID=A0AAV2TVW1_CALDB
MLADNHTKFCLYTYESRTLLISTVSLPILWTDVPSRQVVSFNALIGQKMIVKSPKNSAGFLSKKMRKSKMKGNISGESTLKESAGVNNDSFEMEEVIQTASRSADVITVENVKNTVGKDIHNQPGDVKSTAKWKRRRTKTAGVDNTPRPQITAVNRNEIVGIIIHRSDQLLSNPLLHRIAVRVHIMDEATGKYARRSESEFVVPVTTEPTELPRGHMFLPVWEELMIVDESFQHLIDTPSLVIFFEVLCVKRPYVVADKFAVQASSELVEQIAWAFLRPVGRNSRKNVGPKKQRLQLYRPFPTTNLNQVETNHGPQLKNEALSSHFDTTAGINLLYWWSKGVGYRVSYPSTLYVTVKMVDISQMPAVAGLWNFRTTDVMMTTDCNVGFAGDYVDDKNQDKIDLDETNNLVCAKWRRDPDQLCRVPNALVGCGTMISCFATQDSVMSENRTAAGLSERALGAQCVKFSPQGNMIAVGARGERLTTVIRDESMTGRSRMPVDCPVSIYRYPLKLNGSRPKLHLLGHTKVVYDLSWSPTPIAEQTERRIKTESKNTISATAWLLASASADGTARVWWLSMKHGRIQLPTNGIHNEVVRLSDASTSQTVSGQACTGKTNHQGVFCSVLGHPGFVYSVAFRPVCSDRPSDIVTTKADLTPHPTHILATGCYDHVIRLWKIENNHAELIRELVGHHGAHVNSVVFDTNGDNLYSGDAVGIVSVWSYKPDGTGKKNPPQKYPQTRNVSSWNFSKQISVDEIEGCVINHLAVHPTQRLLLVHTRDSCPKMVDLRSGFIAVRFHGALNHRELLRSCISPCGSFLFAGSEDHNVYVWNAMTGDQVACYRYLQLGQSVTGISYHPTDNVLIFAASDTSCPLRMYAFDPAASEPDISTSVSQLRGTSEGQKYHSDKERLKGLQAKNEKRRAERIRRALKKLDTVSDLSARPIDEESDVDDLEWRPQFTTVDEPRANSRDRPDEKKLAVSAISTSPPKSSQMTDECVAIYDYHAQRSDEVSLQRGDRVKILYTDNPKWCMVKSYKTNTEGFVPSNYLTSDKRFGDGKTTEDSRIQTDQSQKLSSITTAERAKLAVIQMAQLIQKHRTDALETTDQTTDSTGTHETAQEIAISGAVVRDVQAAPQPVARKRGSSRALPVFPSGSSESRKFNLTEELLSTKPDVVNLQLPEASGLYPSSRRLNTTPNPVTGVGTAEGRRRSSRPLPNINA